MNYFERVCEYLQKNVLNRIFNSTNDIPELDMDSEDSHYDDSSRDSFDSTRNVKKKAVERKDDEKQQAIKSLHYLLGISKKYSTFCQQKFAGFAKKNSDTENIAANPSEVSKDLVSSLHLQFFRNGTLRDYQKEGVAWLAMLYDYGINGILADEMGLGKTVQVIAFISYLLQNNAKGPFLIVVPLSTMPNWKSEFERFLPDIPVITFHGSQTARNEMKPMFRNVRTLGKVQIRPIVLTTYEIVSREKGFLSQLQWKYIILDEAQRIKNHKAKLSEDIRSMNCLNKLLLTGTPLQNNVKELWSLLNFIMPVLFKKIDAFEVLLALEDMEDNNKIVEREESDSIISIMHSVLQPFMLRRLKKDVMYDMVPKKEVIVYCPLTKLQRELYEYSLDLSLSEKDPYSADLPVDVDEPKQKRKCIATSKAMFPSRIQSRNTDDDDDGTPISVFKKKHETFFGAKLKGDKLNYYFNIYRKNFWTTLKEICNHPYLIYHPEDPPGSGMLSVDDTLIQISGKMLVLDALLEKLKERGHKVLLFSTFVITLNVLEQYMEYKGIKYCRLDGSDDLQTRQDSIQQFNKDNDVFIFLISTRAGGLGLNLTGADTVILFDRDWNPQVDNQAQDRCHRIGQTKPVVVYSLVTKNTIEEKILKCANMKKRLEKLIIKDGKFRFLNNDKNIDIQELKSMLEAGNEEEIYTNALSGKQIEKLLDRTDLYNQLDEKQKQ